MAMMKPYLGATETTMEAGQEQMDAESKTGLEEVKATESEGNQKKIEAVGETIGATEARYGDWHLAVFQ
jgi:hypothetical protein